MARNKGKLGKGHSHRWNRSAGMNAPSTPPMTPGGSGSKVLSSGTITLPAGAIPSPSGGKSSAFDFSQALLQGNPAALQALENATHADPGIVDPSSIRTNIIDPEKKPSLADEFIVATQSEAKAMNLTGRLLKDTEREFAAYRAEARHAHRFELDDDFVRYATQVSSTTSAEKLLARLQYATLPYEVTWIEFNLREKVRTMRAVHRANDENFDYSEVAETMGLLIHRIDDTTGLVQMINSEAGHRHHTENAYVPLACLIAYFFSTIERPFPRQLHGCDPFTRPGFVESAKRMGLLKDNDEQWREMGQSTLWGYTASDKGGIAESIKDISEARTPSFLRNHGSCAFSRMWSIYERILQESPKEKGLNKALSEVMYSEMLETSGMMRWIVTVLAMLNEVPVRTTLVQRSHQMRAGLTARHKFLDYHRVTLRLPKTKPIPWIERQLGKDAGAKRRAHEVRAHWRTYLHEKYCKVDEHQWVYDHENGYRLCGVCEAFGRMIHEHVRGDPSLGWVDKTYVIKKDKQN